MRIGADRHRGSSRNRRRGVAPGGSRRARAGVCQPIRCANSADSAGGRKAARCGVARRGFRAISRR
ncbi:hypothetical protein BSLA_02r2722 [Burkholderia stabilis]|nr:hypothetical protein BSLA_02r2722 [Burkholderia stabilis]